MNIYTKYNEIKETVLNDVQGVILTPQYFINKFRKSTDYLERLNHVFVGAHRESDKGGKYIITIFVQNWMTKKWVREELFVDTNYNLVTSNYSTNG